MASHEINVLPGDTIVHRVGGGNRENLQLTPLEEALVPPGISVLLGGTPQDAAEQMRNAFPRSRKWNETAQCVGTTTVRAIMDVGFAVLADPTARFPNHARIIHSNGAAGFVEKNLESLASVFVDITGC